MIVLVHFHLKNPIMINKKKAGPLSRALAGSPASAARLLPQARLGSLHAW